MLEGTQNDEKKFFQKCEKWMKFLEKMKEALKTDIPGRFEELQEQQRVYEVKLTLKIEAASWMMKAGGKHWKMLFLLKLDLDSILQIISLLQYILR